MLWNHITSHVMDLIRLGQFYILTYLEVDLSLIIHDLTYLIKSNFCFNLLDQPFELIFWINLCNQAFYWIGSTTNWCYIAFFDKRTYVGEYTPTYWGMYDLGSWLFCRSPTSWVMEVSPLSTSWWRCEWKPCWTQLRLLSYAVVSFVS